MRVFLKMKQTMKWKFMTVIRLVRYHIYFTSLWIILVWFVSILVYALPIKTPKLLKEKVQNFNKRKGMKSLLKKCASQLNCNPAKPLRKKESWLQSWKRKDNHFKYRFQIAKISPIGSPVSVNAYFTKPI